MNQRARKAMGMFYTVGFLTVYCLFFMYVAAIFVTTAHPALQLIYFVIAGLCWLPGVMLIIRWMNRP
ncbi:MAG: DUF2842 domain-containing protein [Aestuariivirgaceae bacterium]|nr:DUF2842 domain-containing protein [Aestuariivirgaceae bacterium]